MHPISSIVTSSSTNNYNYKSTQRLLSYFLSFIGLQRFAGDNNYKDDYCRSLRLSSSGTFASSSTCSFMTGSTLLVEDPGIDDTFQVPEVDSLSPKATCHQTALPNRFAVILAEYAKSTLLSLESVREGAKYAAHRLDSLRPSLQFARASEVSEELESLAHFCRSTLYRDSHLCLAGLVSVAQEALGAPPEVKQYVFGHAKLGRLLVLEMINVFKNFQGPATNDVDLLVRMNDTCAAMARYDAIWEFSQEYEQTAFHATRFLMTP